MGTVTPITKNKTSKQIVIYSRPWNYNHRITFFSKIIIVCISMVVLIGIAIWLPFYLISYIWKKRTYINQKDK